eukprot:scaffold8272_cov20-Tisochrysis_lutea.AAC.1
MSERKLQLLTFDGDKEREWVLDSVIRYIKTGVDACSPCSLNPAVLFMSTSGCGWSCEPRGSAGGAEEWANLEDLCGQPIPHSGVCSSRAACSMACSIVKGTNDTYDAKGQNKA